MPLKHDALELFIKAGLVPIKEIDLAT